MKFAFHVAMTQCHALILHFSLGEILPHWRARGICTLQGQEFSTLSFDTSDQSQIQVSDASSDSSETTYPLPDHI
jgi:hypothetical protein